MDSTVSRDGSLYIYMVQTWYDTNNYKNVLDTYTYVGSWLPPLPFYLMKSLMHIGPSAEIAGVSINIALGTFTPLLSYGIAYEVTQKKDISVCSALLTAVNPSMNSLSIEVQRDMVYLFFIGMTLWWLSAGIRRQKFIYWLGAGIVCGCAMLTRYETLEFLFLVPLILFVLSIGKHCLWKRGICFGVVFLISLLGIVVLLSFMMQTQCFLYRNYKNYYQNKIGTVNKQIYPFSFEEMTK